MTIEFAGAIGLGLFLGLVAGLRAGWALADGPRLRGDLRAWASALSLERRQIDATRTDLRNLTVARTADELDEMRTEQKAREDAEEEEPDPTRKLDPRHPRLRGFRHRIKVKDGIEVVQLMSGAPGSPIVHGEILLDELLDFPGEMEQITPHSPNG